MNVEDFKQWGLNVKSILKFWIPWFIGVITAVFAISLWRNWELDWVLIVIMGIGGLIGGFIAFRANK